MGRLPLNKFVILATLISRAMELTGAAQSIDNEVEFVRRNGVPSVLHNAEVTSDCKLTKWDLRHAALLSALFLWRSDGGTADVWRKLAKNSPLQALWSIAMIKATDDTWIQAKGCVRLSELLRAASLALALANWTSA
jgi:hypothetical protein